MNDKVKKLTLTIGCSGSGKTTLAKKKVEQGWVDINRDNIRADLFCDGETFGMWLKYKFSRNNERQVTEVAMNEAIQAAKQGRNIFISDTNLNPKVRNNWKEFAKDWGYQYEELVVGRDYDLEKLLTIDKHRKDGKPVGKEVILSQWQRFNKQFNRQHMHTGRKKCVIVDVDGTVAKKSKDRGYFDWDKVQLDEPREFVIDMVRELAKKYHIFFLSGRDRSCSSLTRDWIKKYVFPDGEFFNLICREEGDTRNDRTVKEELFWEYVTTIYDVVAAIDDRPRVVRLWKDLGIKNVIDVSESYLEF